MVFYLKVLQFDRLSGWPEIRWGESNISQHFDRKIPLNLQKTQAEVSRNQDKQLTLVLFYCYNCCFLATLLCPTVFTIAEAWQNGTLNTAALEKAPERHCVKLAFSVLGTARFCA